MKQAIVTLLWSLGIMILGLLVRVLLPGVFELFGLVPRTISGLKGIIGMHFIHVNAYHFISNMTAFIPLSIILFSIYPRAAKLAFSIIPITAGILLWLFGRSAVHIGASAWVYGLVSYLITAGLVRKNFWNIVLSIGIAIFYSGMVFGLLPIQNGISWDGHLFGAIGGVLIALITIKRTANT